MRRKLSAISCQLSAKAMSGRVVVWVFTVSLLLVPSAFPDDCSHKMWKRTADKKAAMDLQKFVSEGHQPWRMDGTAAVASEAIQERKKEWADNNTVLGVPEPVSQSKDATLLVATSEDGRVHYEVTLRKYSWLLHAAGNDWRWVIWLPSTVERVECAARPADPW